MLEFQEGFFEQEVRNGFYINRTMKTAWAAELEVLQKVAEICDRHGIVWYAAYGTLLGAVRHEGFVPWDDDMDIWVKRKDYNKLLKILPEELPQGYIVRSPLTSKGYDQFHTLVNSGNRISMDKEWLEQYHGCPFSVGLDIFPLDYLARDAKERMIQENLVKIAARSAQVASKLFRGSDDEAENPEEEKKEFVEEIWEGIKYLEDNCNAKIDNRLIEEEKWFEVASECGKWANYFAMMYEEEESDELVNFISYVRWPWARFPKEWFSEVYGATFENFMLPIPCGYENLLFRIYDAYMFYKGGGGKHDYPYYGRQLKVLREKVSEDERVMEKFGLIIDDIALIPAGDSSLPLEWEQIIIREDGKHKKIILYVNDMSAFTVSAEKAVDKLEETLKQFKKVQESIALWWRPQRNLTERLKVVSEALSKRYQKLLDDYKSAAWGICDETDNADRAVKSCDAYYGDMNAVLQPFQNADKPVILTKDRGDNAADNLDRINECRAFLSFADFVEDDKKFYFANTNYNALVIVDREKWRIEKAVPFDRIGRSEQDVHLRCVKRQNKILFIPSSAQYAHIYDIDEEKQYTYEFENKEYVEGDAEQGTWDYFSSAAHVYLLPDRGTNGLWRWNVRENAIERENWWNVQQVVFLQHGNMDEESFYSLASSPSRLFVTNVAKHTTEIFDLPDEEVYRITYDGENFWYTMKKSLDIVCWNEKCGTVDRYQIKRESDWDTEFTVCAGLCYAAGNLFLLSANYDTMDAIYVLDKQERELRCI
ncbi:MAG: LicD family protein, partial [Lachnospiraceae bacterium]|nr:LicD family protein [Lachnospiraceae bacterium]